MEYVAGYTISNDVSTRDLIERPGFPMTDLLMSKCRPTFFPTGPYIVPAEFVADYRKLRITLSVNGEVMQDEERRRHHLRRRGADRLRIQRR